MNLYEYLEEKLSDEYNWEDYVYDEADILEIKGNYSLLRDIWDLINEWAPEYADEFRGIDASLIVRVLNETVELINGYTSKIPLLLEDVAELCSIYGKCCVFVKNEMAGTEIYEKCKLIVNNTISDCVICKKNPNVVIDDVLECDLEEGCWEEN